MKTLMTLCSLVIAVMLTACSENNHDDDMESMQETVLLTGLVDDLFQRDETSEPETLNDKTVEDNADADSFTYLIESE